MRGFGSSAPVPWTAPSVSGCALWLRASTLALPDGASLVGHAWADGSGNSRNATVNTGAPTYVAQSSNGAPGIRFAGIGSFTVPGDTLLTTPFALPAPYTAWFVMKQITWIDVSIIWDTGDGQATTYCSQATTSPGFFAGNIGNPGAQNNDLAVGAYGLVQFIFDGASSSLAVGTHAPLTGDTTGAAVIGGIGLGGYTGSVFFPTGTVSSNVEISEVILYAGHQSPADTAAVLAGLTRIYGAGV